MHLENEKDMLSNELISMREMSTKVIEDRKHLESERKILETKLAEKTRQTNLLEMKLKRYEKRIKYQAILVHKQVSSFVL